MPAAQFSTMKVDALRKKAIALVQSDTISAQQKATNIQAVKAMTTAQLVEALVAFQQDEAKKKAAAQQQAKKKAAAQQQAKKKSAESQKNTSSTRRSSKQKVAAQRQKSKARIAEIRATAKQTTRKRREESATKAMRSRAGKIMRAMQSPDSKVVVKQGKMKPSDYTTGTSREKYTKFIELYSDVRITKKRRAKKTVKQVFAQIQGQKFPYMIKKARRIPARVGAIPGTKATPFNQLEEAEKRKVVSFLNTEKAKKLRQKGAPREVSFQKLTEKKGAANR